MKKVWFLIIMIVFSFLIKTQAFPVPFSLNSFTTVGGASIIGDKVIFNNDGGLYLNHVINDENNVIYFSYDFYKDTSQQTGTDLWFSINGWRIMHEDPFFDHPTYNPDGISYYREFNLTQYPPAPNEELNNIGDTVVLAWEVENFVSGIDLTIHSFGYEQGLIPDPDPDPDPITPVPEPSTMLLLGTGLVGLLGFGRKKLFKK